MKSIFANSLLGLLMISALSNTAFAAGPTIEQVKARADAEFAMRDYTPEGLNQDQAALADYQLLLTMTTDVDQLAEFNNGVAKAVYFLGDSSSDKAEQKQFFLQGMSAADTALQLYGVADTNPTTLTDARAQSLIAQFGSNKTKMDNLAEAFYQKAANLGQWGQTDIVGALFRWPELRNIADFIAKLNYKSIHGYAPYRIVGRGYYVIPGLLGGDKAKAEKYLEQAQKSSLAVDSTGKTLIFSVDGYNNIYYADALRANNKAAQAKAILVAYVAADPKDAKIFPLQSETYAVIKSQKLAREILSKL